MKPRPTPRTNAAFKYAYDQAMPEYGEGWGAFADIISDRMETMERELEEITHRLAIADPDGETIGMVYDEAGELIDYG